MDPYRVLRRTLSAWRAPALTLLALLATLHVGSAPATADDVTTTYEADKVTPFEFDGDVGTLQQVPLRGATPRKPYRPLLTPPPNLKLRAPAEELDSSVISPPLAPMPSPIQNFPGLSKTDLCGGVPCGAGWPPDINGDVGLNHYIVGVNDAYAIYSKTGTLLAAFTEDQLWSMGGANPCNGDSQGDPIVLYDPLADRWILTHFAFAYSGGNPVSPFYQCIAASKTSDPVSGGWWLYALRLDPGGLGFPPVGAQNDYGKFGIWRDCLYGAFNEYQAPAFIGTAVASFSRSDLYSGAPLTWAMGFINNPTNPFTMIPSNLRGRLAAQLPPPGTPNYFVSESQTTFNFEVRKFTAGPNCGGGGVLSGATNVSQTSYSVPGVDIVPQPGTPILLDSLPDRLMQKVQYRKVATAESVWVVHSVKTSSTSTVRPQWAQIDVTGGVIATTPVQQQIYAPDTTLYRWMPSLAVDNQGNMALGYSTSNGTFPNFPSIAYSGRLAADPLNTLPQTEVQLIAGAGSQTNTCGGAPCHRWGDYTAMSVDPADDCTFWYTNEYYSSPANGASGNWQTRVGSFKFPSCTPPTTFADVPWNHPFLIWVEALAASGITGGCDTNPRRYCPDDAVTRGQMAVFLLRGIAYPGPATPPTPTGTVFADVPLTHPFVAWIEGLFAAGITGGCNRNPPLYCPDDSVTRGQMAVFLLRAKHGATYQPPEATGIFTDVPSTQIFVKWIEQLAREGITGGCATSPPQYCPEDPVTRGQMAVFLVRAFGLPL